MDMAKKNIIAGLVLIAFAAFYAYQIGGLPDRSAMPNTPGPAFFPTLIVVSLFILSAALLLTGIKDLAKNKSSNTEEKFLSHEAALTLLTFLVALIVLPYAGFILTAVPTFAVLMVLYGSRNKLMIGAASITIPIILFVLFRFAFQINLPHGLLVF